MTLREDIEAFIGNRSGKRIAIVGIGSPIRGDDAVGLYVLELLKDKKLGDTLLLRTETVPESYTGKLRDYNPTHVILVDAANFRGEPGEVRIIPTKSISGARLSTHNLPLNIYADYVRSSICPNLILLGVQGVNIDLSEELTPSVETGARNLAEIFVEILGSNLF
jgi:hydrogenase 3 maturation protease